MNIEKEPFNKTSSGDIPLSINCLLADLDGKLVVLRSKTPDGKRQMTFPLADHMGIIFQELTAACGPEAAQKRMSEITNEVIRRRETTQVWPPDWTLSLLWQLEEMGIIETVSARRKIEVPLENLKRQAGYFMWRAKLAFSKRQ